MVNAIPAPTAALASIGQAPGAPAPSMLTLDISAGSPAGSGELPAKSAESLNFASLLSLVTASEAIPQPAIATAARIARQPATGKPDGNILPATLPADPTAPDPATAEDDAAPIAGPDTPAPLPMLMPLPMLIPLPMLAIPVILAPLPVVAEALPRFEARAGENETIPAGLASAPLPVTATTLALRDTLAIAQAPAAITARIGQATRSDSVSATPAANAAGTAAPAGPAVPEAAAEAITIRAPAVPATALPAPDPQPTAATLAARPGPQAPEPATTAGTRTGTTPVAALTVEAAPPAIGLQASGQQTDSGSPSTAGQPQPDSPSMQADAVAPSPAFESAARTVEIVPMGTAGIAVTAPNLAQSAPLVTGLSTGAQDIAALVDRLVEARNAAAAPTIETTVAHGEFGRVGLRFTHEAGALTVAMTSADPGFAPAVQAAAAAQSPGLMQDTGSAPQRQDGRADGSTQPHGGGQAGSAGNGQPQAQPHQAARRDDAAGFKAGPRHRRSDEAGTDTRSRRSDDGIYA